MNERRTFAIISHPDAGKTTLTEKFLLYGGALHLAGTVTARKKQRATASDWMELEKKRGISISSTVLQFDYAGYKINLLDTPGHRDFSEDTYRVLTAVDAVVMVIDGAKGLESQTLKLFEVCRRRRLPTFTFINKMDRESKEPLELIDELEKVLSLKPFPVNWPLGTGDNFRGVYDRVSRQAHLFDRTIGGAHRAPVAVSGLGDPLLADRLDPIPQKKAIEELELLDMMGGEIDLPSVLAGDTTPVYFGSASNNFGVELLLDGFLAHSTPPKARNSSIGMIEPDRSAFSGFIFKIQGNMDPRHRDRVAFMRVCSGKFTRDMVVQHSRTGKQVKLSNSHKLFGRDREILEEAFAGDILGLVGHSEFRIGDTLTEEAGIVYEEIPRFPPECFSYLHNPTPSKFKGFRKGLHQLLQEGIIQSFAVPQAPENSPLLAAVGPLQFEVVKYRLETEYGAESRLETAPWKVVRWVEWARKDDAGLPFGAQRGLDQFGAEVILFPDEWAMKFFAERYPEAVLSDLPPSNVPALV